VNAAVGFQLVVFVLGGEEYGLELEAVREIVRREEMRGHGGTAGAAGSTGSVRSGGEIAPVVALRGRLGLPEAGGERRIMLATHPAGGTVGLLVDDVREVVTVPAGAAEAPPALFGTGEARGTVRVRRLVRLPEDRLVLMLRMEDLFDDAEVERLCREARDRTEDGEGQETTRGE
jgi:purine-binding chemotaxis protein CheW